MAAVESAATCLAIDERFLYFSGDCGTIGEHGPGPFRTVRSTIHSFMSLISKLRRNVPSMSDLKSRSDYKGTWDQLAGSYNDAKLNVAGSVDEAEFDRTGLYSAEFVGRLARVKPTDVVLEIGCGVGRAG